MESIAIIVAHPDDVATSAGGTLLLLKEKFKLHVFCATKGERGVPKKSMSEVAAMREKEEAAACKLLNAELTFLDRIDREVYADKPTSSLVANLLTKITPRAVFTMWPIDSHPDHSAISEITSKALFLSELNTELHYFPANIFSQTTQFEPDTYIDITSVIEKKSELIRCHKCQNVNDGMLKSHLDQSRIYGVSARVEYAEVFKSDKKLQVNMPSVFDSIKK